MISKNLGQIFLGAMAMPQIDYLLLEDDFQKLEKMKVKILSDCGECDNSGHVIVNSQDKKSGWVKTTECSCLKLFRRYKEYYKARIPEVYWKVTEKNFYGDKIALRRTAKFMDYLKNAKDNGLGLMFRGPNGNGKTSLACIIAKYALKKGHSALYGTLQGYLNMIMQSFGQEQKTVLVRKLISEVDFLIVDEIGKEHLKKNAETGSIFGLSEFEQILREREGSKRSVIAITNLDYDKMQIQYGESISSLFSGRLKEIAVQGSDVRKTVHEKSWDTILKEGHI